MSNEYDLAIIGSGPAGYSGAVEAARLGKHVLLIEASAERIGGYWVNTGTVPSKAMREAAMIIGRFHGMFGDEKGRKPYERFRMEDLLRYKNRILEARTRKLQQDITDHRIDMLRGTGTLVNENMVEVVDPNGDHRRITADHILLATGSRPSSPRNFSVDHQNILNYESVLDLTHIPRRLVVVGSGVNAFEYATIFGLLGTRVSLLVDAPELLPFLDEDVRSVLESILDRGNVQVRKGARIRHIRNNPLRNCTEVGFSLAEEGGEPLRILEVDHVLYGGGYVPNTDKLNLEAVNLRTDEDGYIPVNPFGQTSLESVYAAGDVVGSMNRASVSFIQGRLAATHMFAAAEKESAGETHIPYGIYSIPEIAGIGLTQAEAERLGFDVVTGSAPYSRVTQADISRSEDGLLKLVVERDSLKLLGAHCVGEQAAELVHLAQSLMTLGGDVRYFLRNILNYPTYGEAYQIAAIDVMDRIGETAGDSVTG